MPITRAERNKLHSHTFSENKKEEFEGTYLVIPEIPVAGTLRNSLRLLKASPSVFVLNAAGSLILALYAFVVFGPVSFASLLWYTLAFFVLGIVVAAPLSAVAKARLSSVTVTSLLGPMLMSLNFLEPLVAAAYIGIALLAFMGTALIGTVSGWIFAGIVAVMLVVAIILHIDNLNAALSVHIMYDRKFGRNTALGRSWMFLSGQSLKLLAINSVAFLPVAAAIILEAEFRGTPLAAYLALITFVLADISASWWQACTAHIYAEVAKKAKPMNYSRL
jgi:hypothetical protein